MYHENYEISLFSCFSKNSCYNNFIQEAIPMKNNSKKRTDGHSMAARIIAAVCAVLVAASAFAFLFFSSNG